MAFSLAAFDQPVSILFCGPGINWLRKGQNPSEIAQKSVEKNLSAAGIFGVDALLADRSACRQFGLDETDMISDVTLSDFGPDLLDQFQHTTFAG